MAAELARHLAPAARRLCVGLSGGLDSVVLLDILATLRSRLGFHLTALHVHHGLSPNADAWARHAAAVADRLGVPCTVERVRVVDIAALGVEAAARAARYAVFERCAADALCLAHHRDDQAETLLFNLLRGAGPAGLAAMPASRPLGDLQLLRPLLDVPRDALLSHARARALDWVEDESNADPRYDRNFLRHQVMPLLRERFPGCDAALARTAGHAAEAAQLLIAQAEQDLPQCLNGSGGFSLAQAAPLGVPRGRHALRHWLRSQGIVPDERAFEELWRQGDAAPDAMPLWRWRGQRLRCYRRTWYPVHPRAAGPTTPVSWLEGAAQPVASWGGVLEWLPMPGGLDGARLAGGQLSLRRRQGGEGLCVHPGHGTRPLKSLYQEASIAPWLREALPLLYLDDVLIAVPGLGVATEYRTASGWQPVWRALP
ncbi:tRNA lysidine(34) synthetase TilS [Chitiniphilus eburneus]|uniref:tRNA lysidine(34) synthetase TilS n=1 Tax=Chitiniphilus eburneus TaxID=2571148 RepID=UPI00145DE4C9|nr:tRNA lysidine(34) synthetase TilS [Chitiniphilus eburneus]